MQRTTSKRRRVARELQTTPEFTHAWEYFELTIKTEKKEIVNLTTIQYEFTKMKHKEDEN